jgi:hypothetical protein
MSNWLEVNSEHARIEEMGLDFSYPDVWDLLPVAILCVISILFTILWLLAVWEYVRLRDRKQSRTAYHTDDLSPLSLGPASHT